VLKTRNQNLQTTLSHILQIRNGNRYTAEAKYLRSLKKRFIQTANKFIDLRQNAHQLDAELIRIQKVFKHLRPCAQNNINRYLSNATAFMEQVSYVVTTDAVQLGFPTVDGLKTVCWF
jgi:N-glycosylase/DNA lyase